MTEQTISELRASARYNGARGRAVPVPSAVLLELLDGWEQRVELKATAQAPALTYPEPGAMTLSDLAALAELGEPVELRVYLRRRGTPAESGAEGGGR